jgi:hypothetical protein
MSNYMITITQLSLSPSLFQVCEGAVVYECYVTIKDGTYILRLGGGLFGLLTGYPQPGATWSGCGRSG